MSTIPPPPPVIQHLATLEPSKLASSLCEILRESALLLGAAGERTGDPAWRACAGGLRQVALHLERAGVRAWASAGMQAAAERGLLPD